MSIVAPLGSEAKLFTADFKRKSFRCPANRQVKVNLLKTVGQQVSGSRPRFSERTNRFQCNW